MDAVLIGQIVGVHGIKGNCKFRSYAESLSVFQSDNVVFVAASDGRQKPYEINWVKSHAKTALISLKGVDTRDQAQALIGCELFIEKSRLPDPEEGSYYWFDPIIETGSNDVYVVKEGDMEILIPALESVVQNIDLKKRRMQVDLPEGLD